MSKMFCHFYVQEISQKTIYFLKKFWYFYVLKYQLKKISSKNITMLIKMSYYFYDGSPSYKRKWVFFPFL